MVALIQMEKGIRLVGFGVVAMGKSRHRSVVLVLSVDLSVDGFGTMRKAIGTKPALMWVLTSSIESENCEPVLFELPEVVGLEAAMVVAN
ncbi:hypothetical protein DY000_02059472 [Brassica cretica]|uniref:Uncharacterized protein n=1 Tax=Brassica cretica TaxID=69181 RepID=A0ABQ7B4L5_BRACR|nr:hypothetical protein DY000_02059472 [Brassica cretica]